MQNGQSFPKHSHFFFLGHMGGEAVLEKISQSEDTNIIVKKICRVRQLPKMENNLAQKEDDLLSMLHNIAMLLYVRICSILKFLA